MEDSPRISVELDEILNFLKKNFQLKEIYHSILSQKIINQVAEEKGLTVSAEEIQAEADQQRLAKRLEKASDTIAWLGEQMITAEDWEAGICDRLLAKKLAKFLFHKEVEKFFAQNKVNFDQILLYQIIVADQKLAQELLYEIEEREISFYDAAHLYDIDERRRQQCGFEGKLYRWNLNPNIAAAVFSKPPGNLIGPLKTALGYHLLMVETFIPAELTPERYEEILDGMFQDWLTNEINYRIYSQIV